MSIFERYLSVWVFMCIVTGIALGQFLPGVFQLIGGLSVAQLVKPFSMALLVSAPTNLRPVISKDGRFRHRGLQRTH